VSDGALPKRPNVFCGLNNTITLVLENGLVESAKQLDLSAERWLTAKGILLMLLLRLFTVLMSRLSVCGSGSETRRVWCRWLGRLLSRLAGMTRQ